MMNYYDIIVIGAGIEGSAAAMHCATDGAKTLLLEQFEFGHTMGSSAGGTRIIRKGYTDGFYTKMMLDAYNMWGEIERDSGNIKLIEQTGGLCFVIEGSDKYVQTVASLTKHNVAYQVYSASETKHHYPYVTIPDEFICVYEPSAGVLYARKALQAIQRIFESRGGVLLDRHKVINIIPSKMGLVTVDTDRGTFTCGKLILCAGPWTNKLTEPIGLKLPITPKRCITAFWKKIDMHNKTLPIIVYYSKDLDKYYYALDCEYPGLCKASAHHGIQVDPDDRDAFARQEEVIQMTSQAISETLKCLSTTPSIIETCIYAITDDYHPFIDKHPLYSNIIIGAGFSGHGFKLAPIVGRILASLANANRKVSIDEYDISPFKINRGKPQLSKL